VEQKIKQTAIVSRSTAADNEEKDAGKRERECVCVCVCVCWLRVSRFNDSKRKQKGGKRNAKLGHG